MFSRIFQRFTPLQDQATFQYDEEERKSLERWTNENFALISYEIPWMSRTPWPDYNNETRKAVRELLERNNRK